MPFVSPDIWGYHTGMWTLRSSISYLDNLVFIGVIFSQKRKNLGQSLQGRGAPPPQGHLRLCGVVAADRRYTHWEKKKKVDYKYRICSEKNVWLYLRLGTQDDSMRVIINIARKGLCETLGWLIKCLLCNKMRRKSIHSTIEELRDLLKLFYISRLPIVTCRVVQVPPKHCGNSRTTTILRG